MNGVKHVSAARVWAGLSGLAASGAVGHFAIKKHEGTQCQLRNFATHNAFASLSAMFGMVSATSGISGLGLATRVVATGMTGVATSIPTIVVLALRAQREIELQKKVIGLTIEQLVQDVQEKRRAEKPK